MKNFILEIGTVEIPARFIGPALDQLKKLAENLLREKRIDFAQIKAAGTPRRLAVYLSGLPESQKPLTREIKGPALKVAFNSAHEPTPAALGFAKSQGVAVTDLVVKPVGPVEYVFAVKSEKSRPVAEVLAEICPALITGIQFPKPMRWGSREFRFVRPIRWLLALLDHTVVKFSVAGFESGRVTYGHRFLSEGPIELKDAADYFDILKNAYVIADPEERKTMIRRQIEDAARSCRGVVLPDEELLDEVTNLLEYPTAFAGDVDLAFMRLPEEVLVTPMREHQKYFPVHDASGRLLPKFIGVRNGLSRHIETVRTGNEKVLRARLADAAFFWDEDLKTPLADRVPALKKIVWQESLGTVYDKVQRVAALASFIGGQLGAGKEVLRILDRAALLCKADLVTGMVYEFTELQGIMGREYALRSNEDPAVAEAIFEHYLPRFAGDILPRTTAGRILSLADKFDTLVGCFAAGIQPTGSQDPYALRRQALGICNIILEGGLLLSLRDIAAQAYGNYTGFTVKAGCKSVLEDLDEFFKQRVRGILTERGFSYDIIDAVLSPGADDIPGVLSRAEALRQFRGDPAFDAVITAFNRANNLTKNYSETLVSPVLLGHPAERDLYEALNKVSREINDLLAKREYAGALYCMAGLREPVDNFFNAVMVMVDDENIRDNRLALLKSVSLLAAPIADLSKIVVAG